MHLLSLEKKEILQSLHVLNTFGMNSLSSDFYQHLSNIESLILVYFTSKMKQTKIKNLTLSEYFLI